MKRLPVGISTFSEIIEENFIYVDKTQAIYEMVNTGKTYFLSRPRRFGKSLLVSTLEELFKGNKELFKGLYIYNKWDWTKSYTVVKINLGKGNYKIPGVLEDTLDETINRIAREFTVKIYSKTLAGKFTDLIIEIYKKTGKKIVVLIDEYDFPIIDSIKNIEIAEKNRDTLSGFYQVLKASDEYLRFIFLTGVTKFSKTSIFSGLNNLDDITFNKDFSCICGYTQEELEDNFKDYLIKLQDELSYTNEEALEKIKHWYDGYSWDGKNKVYNPFSVLKLFKNNEFTDYWFETGTPEFLIDVLKNSKDYTEVLEPITVKQSRFKTFSYENIDPITVFFQTGYLTIAKKMIFNDIIHYKLEFPNFEVESSLLDHLLDLNLKEEKTAERKEKIISFIKNEDNNSFQKEMKGFLARI
ncbi:MAG: AAA family ATPase, partial [Methanobrevibacter sp.]|nr:AAA family ATPase [Methanobrevibacter sp.]